jgi:hypothetical protein
MHFGPKFGLWASARAFPIRWNRKTLNPALTFPENAPADDPKTAAAAAIML